jgi:hypothetical protein
MFCRSTNTDPKRVQRQNPWHADMSSELCGYILSPMSANEPWKEFKVAQVQRWYSMGKILIPDFNGDGVVSPTISGADYQMAYAATHPAQQPERFVFATGNIVNITPNERVVDIEDWLAWEKAWRKYVEEGVHSGPLVEMDYGFAKTIDCR